MSRKRRKPTHDEAGLKAMCIVAISEQLTAQEISDELLRLHNVLKVYLQTVKNGK